MQNEDVLEQKYFAICEKLLTHHLPEWNELPDIELYMDQVIAVMEKALNIYKFSPEESVPITPSIINNYVKLKVIPAPNKKRYSKTHLVYLIIICILKQTLAISSIVKIIENLLATKSIEEVYKDFCKLYKESLSFTNIKETETDINFNSELVSANLTEDMSTFILKSAILSTTSKFMCEGILSALNETPTKDLKEEKGKK